MNRSLFSYLVALMLTAVCLGASARKNVYAVSSPDKNLTVEVMPGSGAWTYSVSLGGEARIAASLLGFKDDGGAMLPAAGWEVVKAGTVAHNSVWKPLWGKRSEVKDAYRELSIKFSHPVSHKVLELKVRAYNDCVALRYELERGIAGRVTEATEYAFAGDYTAWSYNGENHNLGPELLTASEGLRRPVMTIDAGDCFMALHEACLEMGEPLRLTSEKGSRTFKVLAGERDLAALDAPYRSAWRVVMCAREVGTLVDSHALELLNPEPAQGMDFSWVRPGVDLWDWRIDGAVWDGYRYGMDYASWTRMIDFAQRNGFPNLVLDANWYGPEFSKDSDPVKGDKAKDVQRIIAYGKERGVGVWLYLNDVGGMNYPIEETLKQYGQWGAAGVKYGFMGGSPEEKNHKTRRITELCAQNRLMVDYHDDPVHPYGQMRTWPNAVTREYCKAQLDGHDIFFPKTFVTTVFVNMLAGPLDMNNGMFELHQGRTTRVDNNQEVPSTLVAEAARTQIVFSGATVIPDIPEYYEKYPALLRFLGAQKQPWRESRTLSGRIGEYIVMMRQASDGAFLIGAATNEEARTLAIPLDFLPKGSFTAEVTQDGLDAHYLKNRETLETSTLQVTRQSVLTVSLAPGGGACILIK